MLVNVSYPNTYTSEIRFKYTHDEISCKSFEYICMSNRKEHQNANV